ncbi:MAG: 2-C-methyl-D-erythritol 4-phosphate cytidylyltransferase [Actinomycetia bacterium]|nr:2-C-methyl-D-erythritol 4-phosphate cytidylyltransferase [Actinomycetes bacterium]
MPSRTFTVVVAAGGGARFGTAKQFVRLAGVTVVERAIAVATEATDGVVVVLPADTEWRPAPPVLHAVGGATRSDSVRAGLDLVPDDVDIVAVHDAARPLATSALFAAVIDAVRRGADGAIPVLPIVDTVKRVDGDRILETVARDDLVVVQTPQAFRLDVLRAAHASGGVDTDDAALAEAVGGNIVSVPGDPRNVKLTVAYDLEFLRAMLDDGSVSR